MSKEGGLKTVPREWTLEIFPVTGDIRSALSVKSIYLDYMVNVGQEQLSGSRDKNEYKKKEKKEKKGNKSKGFLYELKPEFNKNIKKRKKKWKC